jgi:general secretion pathway protein C
MELIFRKYFWAVNFTFLFCAALLAARTANLFVEYALSPSPSSGAPKVQARSHTAIEQAIRVDLDRLAKLAGLAPPPPEPDVHEPGAALAGLAAGADPNADAVKSGMRVKLLGTLLSGVSEWSFASVLDQLTSHPTTYMTGDIIQGAKIADIERSRVIIINNGRREFIDATGGDGTAPPVTVKKDDAPASVALGNGIKAVNDNSYVVPRGEIDKTLSNLNDVAMQARIVPAFKDGQAEGFKLFSIRPDSIYTKIGIQNGDVIKRINGYDLNSPEKALEIYSKLKEAGSIQIELDRNGSNISKSYSIQ